MPAVHRFPMSVAIALCLAAAAALAQDYKPVTCKAPLPYQGTPVYAKPVVLPPADFTFGGAFDDATTGRLNQAMTDAMKATGAAVMTAAVATPAGVWHATRAADGSNAPLRLYWASAGKAFTAVVVMQLVEEGRLALGDPASRWVRQIPNAPAITVDHLLHHTSGLFSANEDPAARAQPRYRTPDEGLAISASHGAMFCPGQYWRYSNTGYAVLGRIIEQVDRRSYAEAVNARVMAPLGLPALRALEPADEPADVAPLVPTTDAGPKMQANWGYAAGSVVGSAEDMIRFWHALLSGKLLSAVATSRLFDRLYPMFDQGTYYGRGVMLYVVPDPVQGERVWLGHSGGAPGIKSIVAYSAADRAFVAVALTADGSAEATANLLLRQLQPPR